MRAMKKILACVLAAASFLWADPPKPKLVLAIVVDQFRYDYLTRFRSEYHAGLERLLSRGAVFTNARYEHFPTVTAIGHSTFLSGATPSLSGIIGNDWYDREEGKTVTSVVDSTTKLLGGNSASVGSSPHRMLVDTVGDELKMSNGSQSKVIGISLKDRAAILPVGHMANGAYWFDSRSGNFVSSTYYFADPTEDLFGLIFLQVNPAVARTDVEAERTQQPEHMRRAGQEFERLVYQALVD